MEELLIAIVQFLIEVLAQALVQLPFDLAAPNRPSVPARTFRYVAFLLLGGVIGGLSIVLIPRTMLQYGALRIANVIVAPLVAGYVASRVTEFRAKRDFLVVPRIHYWSAFWFTLAFAVVRFAYARH